MDLIYYTSATHVHVKQGRVLRNVSFTINDNQSIYVNHSNQSFKQTSFTFTHGSQHQIILTFKYANLCRFLHLYKCPPQNIINSTRNEVYSLCLTHGNLLLFFLKQKIKQCCLNIYINRSSGIIEYCL